MSLELVNTLATFGTFLVIAATAIAAIVQLRHARSSNQIAAINELRETENAPDFQAARHFVETQLAAKLQDPAFRYQVATPDARTDETRSLFAMIRAIGNFYEDMGLLVRTGLVDREFIAQSWNANVLVAWESLAPVTALNRQARGNVIWENFEYLTVLAQDWEAAHAKGTYPAGMRRIKIDYPWLDADKEYAAALAPA
jgi:hypothetical protein